MPPVSATFPQAGRAALRQTPAQAGPTFHLVTSSCELFLVRPCCEPGSAGHWGFTRSWSLNIKSVFGELSHKTPFCSFLVLTVISLQTLPFVARLNSSMGPGRTVVIKGEVNTNAKGSVPLLAVIARIRCVCVSCCLRP